MQTPKNTTTGDITIVINNHTNASIRIDRADDQSNTAITINSLSPDSKPQQANDSPPLNPGEIYVGKITFEDGTGNHIILLPGDNDAASWKKQMEWATSIGGELPDRVEGALLYARFKKEFKEEWYWLREQHASGGDVAWVQTFDYGLQFYDRKGYDYRARAVRRIPIQ